VVAGHRVAAVLVDRGRYGDVLSHLVEAADPAVAGAVPAVQRGLGVTADRTFRGEGEVLDVAGLLRGHGEGVGPVGATTDPGFVLPRPPAPSEVLARVDVGDRC